MKKTFMTLTMGMALVAGMTLTSCGEKKTANAEQTATEQETTETASTPKPADLKTFKASTLGDAQASTAANVGFAADVQSTPENLMENNTSLKALYFENELGMIGTASFKGCTSLENIYADQLIMVVGDEAFMGCTSLKECTIRTNTYGLNAFDGCSSLEKVIMKDGWTIRDNALANCPALKTVIVPMTIEKIEEKAFENTANIEELAIPYNYKDRMYTLASASKNLKKVFILTPAAYKFPTTASAKALNKSQCEAYVPNALVKDFQADETWAGFAAIKPLSESGYFDAQCNIK